MIKKLHRLLHRILWFVQRTVGAISRCEQRYFLRCGLRRSCIRSSQNTVWDQMLTHWVYYMLIWVREEVLVRDEYGLVREEVLVRDEYGLVQEEVLLASLIIYSSPLLYTMRTYRTAGQPNIMWPVIMYSAPLYPSTTLGLKSWEYIPAVHFMHEFAYLNLLVGRQKSVHDSSYLVGPTSWNPAYVL